MIFGAALLFYVAVASSTTLSPGVLFNISGANVTYNVTSLLNVSNVTTTATHLIIDDSVLNYTSPVDTVLPLYEFSVYTKNVLTNATITTYTTIVEDERPINVSTNSTTSGVTVHIVTNRTYTIYLLHSNINTSATKTVNVSTNYTFYVFINNTLSNFYFFDEETTQTLAGTNVSIEFISDAVAYNRTTITGELSQTLPSPDSYTLRYGADGYTTKFRYLDVLNDTPLNVSLYLTALSTGPDNVTVTVLNQDSDPVEDATVQVLRYDPYSNSYLIVEEIKTNFEGEGVVDLTLGSEFYKFLVYYGGELKKETSPTYIYSNTLTIYINTQAGIGEVYEQTQGVSHSIIFNNGTNTFKYTYSDANEVISESCLTVYRISGTERTQYNISCSSAYTGILYASVANVSGRTYLAEGTVKIGSERVLLESLIHKFEDAGAEIFGKNGILITILLTLTSAGLGALYRPSMAVLLTPTPLVVLTAVGVISLSIGIALGLQFIAVILAAVVES